MNISTVSQLALANQSYIFSQIISLQFYITTLKLRNNWSSRGFHSNFAAYGLKFLDEIHWPVHSECLDISFPEFKFTAVQLQVQLRQVACPYPTNHSLVS